MSIYDKRSALSRVVAEPDFYAHVLGHIQLGRIGLAVASMVTGVNILIDGGGRVDLPTNLRFVDACQEAGEDRIEAIRGFEPRKQLTSRLACHRRIPEANMMVDIVDARLIRGSGGKWCRQPMIWRD
ncbi:hypothetical protein [Mesorhizobium sp.]|uniref:hypothetical protein n=1 Tax=Mesorhizobium sp. TaxID=1871066 RepID=UPI0025B8DC17|nr:hypothetical protein [Mesorhizobium sp.]